MDLKSIPARRFTCLWYAGGVLKQKNEIHFKVSLSFRQRGPDTPDSPDSYRDRDRDGRATRNLTLMGFGYVPYS